MGTDELVTGGDVDDPSVDSLTTDDVTINNAPSGDDDAIRWQEAVEAGTSTQSGPDASGISDGSWNTKEKNSTTETFTNAFGSTPTLTYGINVDDGYGDGWLPTAFNISATSFDWVAVQYEQKDRSDSTAAIDYQATEGR